jgi:hypothetical protein
VHDAILFVPIRFRSPALCRSCKSYRFRAFGTGACHYSLAGLFRSLPATWPVLPGNSIKNGFSCLADAVSI